MVFRLLLPVLLVLVDNTVQVQRLPVQIAQLVLAVALPLPPAVLAALEPFPMPALLVQIVSREHFQMLEVLLNVVLVLLALVVLLVLLPVLHVVLELTLLVALLALTAPLVTGLLRPVLLLAMFALAVNSVLLPLLHAQIVQSVHFLALQVPLPVLVVLLDELKEPQLVLPV
jgi:hypothetical protein